MIATTSVLCMKCSFYVFTNTGIQSDLRPSTYERTGKASPRMKKLEPILGRMKEFYEASCKKFCSYALEDGAQNILYGRKSFGNSTNLITRSFLCSKT